MQTRINQLRKELKITQEELADKVDVTRQTIISLEQGKYNPSLLLAHKISKALQAKKIEDVFLIDDN
ncbi:helix-turn-helix transcriptional regulator [Patescibacteria group bacterium]|nr:helix-turn-helix transcriptional regulator [Patescibacteria group bacterium]